MKPESKRARDVTAWHSPRPWRVERDGRRALVVDAEGIPVTVSICVRDAERIVAMGNDTEHHHD